jgi:hypothetical protein
VARVIAGNLHSADSDGAGFEFIKRARDLSGIAGQLGFHGHDIGGTEGEEPQWDIGTDHAVEHFVEGSVAAGRQDEIGAAYDALARDASRGDGSGGGPDVEFGAVGAKGFEGLAEPVGMTKDLARVRIVDDCNLTITCDTTDPRLGC